MSKHTPGPWNWKVDGASLPIITHKSGIIALVKDPGSGDWDEVEANAEHIVRACNAYDDLLAAAQNAVNVLAALATFQLKSVTPDSPAIAQLRSAIAKAQGN